MQWTMEVLCYKSHLFRMQYLLPAFLMLEMHRLKQWLPALSWNLLAVAHCYTGTVRISWYVCYHTPTNPASPEARMRYCIPSDFNLLHFSIGRWCLFPAAPTRPTSLDVRLHGCTLHDGKLPGPGCAPHYPILRFRPELAFQMLN